MEYELLRLISVRWTTKLKAGSLARHLNNQLKFENKMEHGLCYINLTTFILHSHTWAHGRSST